MDVVVERQTEEAQLAMTCGCGSCHPTATAYRDDPQYKWHDPRLADRVVHIKDGRLVQGS